MCLRIEVTNQQAYNLYCKGTSKILIYILIHVCIWYIDTCYLEVDHNLRSPTLCTYVIYLYAIFIK